MKRLLSILTLALCFSACNDSDTLDTVPPCVGPECQASTLPLSSTADAPTVTDVTLECQTQAVVLLATATDPQGTDNLLGVAQTIGVYRNDSCQGTPDLVQDDVAGSGVEESFGDVVSSSTDKGLYDAICGCDVWPVTVRFSDIDGNVTEGTVPARVAIP